MHHDASWCIMMHHASCIMHHALCIMMHHASCIMHHASWCIMHHASCIMHHASCIRMHHAPWCIMHHVSCIMNYSWFIIIDLWYFSIIFGRFLVNLKSIRNRSGINQGPIRDRFKIVFGHFFRVFKHVPKSIRHYF